MNSYLKDQSPGRQFLAFLALATGFFLVNAVVTSAFFSDLSTLLTNKSAVISADDITRFKWAQLVSSTLIFIVPAIAFGYFSSPRMMPYLGVRPRFSVLLGMLAVVLLFAVQPFVSWLGELNSKVNFGSMQKQLQDMEAMYNRAMETFIKMNNVGDLLINLFIMALLPAIGEELFFRGSLQKAVYRMSNKPVVAILISSLVFAFLHGTFFKIIPIFVLGVLLGTLYHFTRNLWYNILLHFLNNAFAVLAVYFGSNSSFLQKLANDELKVPLYFALVSAVTTIAVVLFMKRKSDEVLPAYETDDDNDIF